MTGDCPPAAASAHDLASSAVIASTSAMERPPARHDSASGPYRVPLQSSQIIQTSGRKSMLTRICPRPSQASHRPPGLDVEKSRLRRPRAFAPGEAANSARMASKQPTYVAALLQGDAVSGAAPTTTAARKGSRIRNASQLTAAADEAAGAARARSSDGAITSKTSDDLPLPDTPVTATRPPAGTSTSRPRRLWAAAPRTLTPGRSVRRAAVTAGRPRRLEKAARSRFGA